MRPKIYLFGDEITEKSFEGEGWGANLACHFSRLADVVLRGYSGYNTRWAVKGLERVFPLPEMGGADQPVAMTVFFGANDALLPDGFFGFQHVPILEYKQNLRTIVSFLQNRWPSIHIILITPPPIDRAEILKHPYVETILDQPARTNKAAGTYAKACVEVAGECGIPVIDLWTRMQKFPDWSRAFLRQGLDLSEDGNTFVFEVVKRLKKVGLSLESLPVDLPLIDAIDRNDPLKAFEQ